MPTNVQRASSIFDALLNGTATASQRQRVLDAYNIGSSATNEEVAEVIITNLLNIIKNQVKAYEHRTAIDAASAQVETDFTPNV